MQIPLVDLKAQYDSIREEVNAAIQGVLNESCFILGPPVENFEREFADYCQAKHAVGVASGTDALHLALRAMDIGEGDEVIVPGFTFVATALGVSLAGATPVLVDVRREDGLMDPDRIAPAITSRTKAIIPVHLYGRCCDMDNILAIADAHGVQVLEDAAQAHGADYKGRRAGSLGHAAGFSFYPGKNLGAYGDGGAITTNDDELADRLRMMRNWGSRRKYFHEEIGLNSRLDAVHAAVLSVKLKHLDDWNDRRRAHAATFDRLLAAHPDVRRPEIPEDGRPVYHIYAVRVLERAARLERMQQQGIQAGVHYPFPLHHLKACREVVGVSGTLREAEDWAAECLSLPIFPELTNEQAQFIVNHLTGAQRKAAA